MSSLSIYMLNLFTVTFIMVLAWLVSLYKANVNIVDSLWGVGFFLIVWSTWFQVPETDRYWPRSLLLVLLTTIWAVRLTVYLFLRNYKKGEDSRYAKWRKDVGARFWIISLFKIFLLQAFFLWMIALSVQAGQMSNRPAQLGLLDLIGTSVWLTGFVFETIGDWQLARFKSNPKNRRKVMKQGLWRYTRHPNYFGECLIWWGLFVIALSDINNGWTIISPIIMTLVLLKMTGIPLTEEMIVKKRPGYQSYINSTPAFIPWIPKKED